MGGKGGHLFSLKTLLYLTHKMHKSISANGDIIPRSL